MRVKGRGVPAGGRHGAGDLLVTIAVTLPKKLTRHQRALLDQLGQALGDEGEEASA
jgi:DnaJ-class molecular chaperone